MNRQEFMNRLEYLLRGIPASEREDALGYYNDYFDEAGDENEYQVIQELRSPEAVAENILADVQSEQSHASSENQGMSKSNKILLIIVLVLTFPLWIGVVAGLFGTVVGVISAAFGIVVGMIGAAFGLVVGGIACIVAGIVRFAFAPIEALASIGVGAVLTAIGLLLALLGIWCVGVWLPKLVKSLVNWIKGLIHRNKGGNEI